MNQSAPQSFAEPVNAAEHFRSVLKSQYHASLDMLKEAIERCPDDSWDGAGHVNQFWQIAYHTLFFTHLYLMPTEFDFEPWEGHQGNVQHPDGLPGPADPESSLPLLPNPYTKEEVMAYWNVCDGLVDDAVDGMDLYNPDCGFHWYKISKLEHQIVNIRHLQHGVAQLADRVRAAANVGTDWKGWNRRK